MINLQEEINKYKPFKLLDEEIKDAQEIDYNDMTDIIQEILREVKK